MAQPNNSTPAQSPQGQTQPVKVEKSPRPDVQAQILTQLTTLVRMQEEAAGKRFIFTEFLWNLLLQVIGLLIAGLFGAFAVLSWRLGHGSNSLSSKANDLSSRANSLSTNANSLATKSNCLAGAANWLGLANICLITSNLSICNDFASDFDEYAESLYSSIRSQATSCFTAPTATTSTGGGPTSSAPSSNPSSGAPAGGSGQLAGIIVASVLAALFILGTLYLPYRTYRTKFLQKTQPAVVF